MEVQTTNAVRDEATASATRLDRAEYDALYKRSTEDPDGFWSEHALRIDWMTPFQTVRSVNFNYPDVSIAWFADGTLNASANCIDRHLDSRGDQTAIIFEPDDPAADAQHITYRQLHNEVSTFANVLKELGVSRGDRVILYLPMIPEAAYAMLACTRIGAIHSVVFAGFSPDALANRIDDCEAKVVVTADGAPRGGRVTNLKDNVNKALNHCADNPSVLVVKRTGQEVAWIADRDHWLHEMAARVSNDCPPEEMNAEDPLFILYTSGSTGKPKGVVHTTGGYLVWAAVHQKMSPGR